MYFNARDIYIYIYIFILGGWHHLDRPGRQQAVQAAGPGRDWPALLSLPEEWHYGKLLIYSFNNFRIISVNPHDLRKILRACSVFQYIFQNWCLTFFSQKYIFLLFFINPEINCPLLYFIFSLTFCLNVDTSLKNVLWILLVILF